MINSNTGCKEWASRYEQLRQSALSVHQSNNNNWGMALFVRHGMAGWMRAWPKSDAQAKSDQYQPAETSATHLSVPSSLRGQITNLLANMILNGHKEVALC